MAAQRADAPPMTVDDDLDFNQLLGELERLHQEADALRTRVRELETLADTDPLAPIYNRRAFVRELTRMLAFGQRYGVEVGVVYIDLDGFKPINDRHGHHAGDWVLRHVAALLRKHVRDSDIVGRMGGDEFALGLAAGGLTGAEVKARQVEEALRLSPPTWDSKPLKVGLSAGAIAAKPGESADQAIARADAAMYEAKRQRKEAA